MANHYIPLPYFPLFYNIKGEARGRYWFQIWPKLWHFTIEEVPQPLQLTFFLVMVTRGNANEKNVTRDAEGSINSGIF